MLQIKQTCVSEWYPLCCVILFCVWSLVWPQREHIFIKFSFSFFCFNENECWLYFSPIFLQLFESILLTLPRQTGGGGKSPAEVIDELSADILSKFPPPFDMEMVMEKYPVIYEESMNTVLRQELIRFNRLTTVVRKTLQNLQKAIKVVYLVSVHNNNRFIWQKNRSVTRQRRV